VEQIQFPSRTSFHRAWKFSGFLSFVMLDTGLQPLQRFSGTAGDLKLLSALFVARNEEFLEL
jgi:hypothetical protein